MRRPPILGGTGFDFGYKPAISMVLPRKKVAPLLDTDDAIVCGIPSVHSISIQATLSGTVSSDETCGEVDIDISVVTSTMTATASEAGCVGEVSTGAYNIDYLCPESCNDFNIALTFEAIATLTTNDDINYLLSIEAILPEQICGRDVTGGGMVVFEMDLGPDPTGTHSLSFYDGVQPSIHYDFVVNIVL